MVRRRAPRFVLGIDVSTRRIGIGAVEYGSGRALGCAALTIELSRRDWKIARISGFLREHDWTVGRDCAAVWIERPALPKVSGTDAAFKAGRAVQAAVSACELCFPGLVVRELRDAEWKDRADVRLHKGATLKDVHAAADPPWPAPSSAKPDVYLRALELGFSPQGSQDAADAALVARAGWITMTRERED